MPGINPQATSFLVQKIWPVIDKSHQGDLSVPAVNEMYYAAGWQVNAGQTMIEHSGGNPNFSTQVTLLPKEGKAVCLLTNGANTNISLVQKIIAILDGNLTQSYEISGTQLLDILLSSATIIFCLLAVLFFLSGLRRVKRNEPQPITKKTIIVTVIFLAATILSIMCWAFPMFIGYGWSKILVWQTYSVLTALISSSLLSASIAWFVYTQRYHASLR